jgi:hypothetical protein
MATAWAVPDCDSVTVWGDVVSIFDFRFGIWDLGFAITL